MIDSNTWYYTLSTISQTLAAIIALGGAFVVFKLDKIRLEINSHKLRAIDILMIFEPRAKSDYLVLGEEEVVKQLGEKLTITHLDKALLGLDTRVYNRLYDYVVKDLKSSGSNYNLVDKEVYAALSGIKSLLKLEIENKKNIFLLLKLSLSATALIISSSIILLPLNTMLNLFANEFFIAMIFCSVAVVIFDAWSIWSIVKR